MWCHEIRACVHKQLQTTTFCDDGRVTTVHVDNVSSHDHVRLTAYDRHGRRLRSESLPVHGVIDRLHVAPEFDHDFTDYEVPVDSELAEVVERATGWVINMQSLRDYDLVADRRVVQRTVTLANLADMTSNGEAHSFGL